MKVLAVCIGVDNAGDFTKLDNAINDAVAMQDVFQSFGYETILKTDITMDEWIVLSAHLHSNLKNYDSFIFFYAGHGIEVDGENYLTFSETTQYQETKAYYDRRAIRLSEILELEKGNLSISKIIIVDACRDNPRGVRGTQAEEFAPIATPRGTLIAFSTTSGEKAADTGYPNNSAYSGTLVHHLKNSSNIQAETLFKRVRQSVYSITGGKKVTWEHTSLINEFYFQKPLPTTVDFGYPIMYINDSTYDFSDKIIPPMVANLQISDWYKQEDALKAFLSHSPSRYNHNEKFLIGRWIVRSAVYGNFKAQHILYDDVVGFLNGFSEIGNINHLLNGMLFELYFNNLAQFRLASVNIDATNSLLSLRNNGLFLKSFDYINSVLSSYADSLFFYPVSKGNTDPIIFDVILGEVNSWGGKKQIVKEVHLNGKDVTDKITATIGSSIRSTDSFKRSLTALNLPIDLISINAPIDLKDIDINSGHYDTPDF